MGYVGPSGPPSEASQFRQYADDALRWAANATTEKRDGRSWGLRAPGRKQQL
jgi:hypothetical protein